jgi:hypothetical protein
MVTAANSTMKGVLRSPLHGLVSNRAMLITFLGAQERQVVHDAGELRS